MNPDEHERLLGPGGVTVHVHRGLLAAASDPYRIRFAFGPMGSCRVTLSPHTVLFACVHNAGRSQMAAGLFNALADPARALAVSAGTRPGASVHPEVVDAMREVGVDLAGARPRLLTAELAAQAALLVTMGCGEECPVVSGLAREDWPLDDPAGRPAGEVRRIRDEIRARVEALVEAHGWKK